MELWIRSQDKEILMKVNHLDIDESNNIIEYNNLMFLGHYNTFERALEVLDEIQNIINNDGVENEEYDKTSGCYYTVKKNVYQMPSE